jgi:hypothetical protein
MARIQSFPQNLLVEHARWHLNMRMGVRSAGGEEFLTFHRDFMKKALDWYRAQDLEPKAVKPWTSIPSEIKDHPRWNTRLQNAEDRVMNDISSFDSPEELGNFLLNSSLHSAVHVLGSQVFREPDFGQINLSPRSTYFYNWHGLIDKWWKQLEKQVKK